MAKRVGGDKWMYFTTVLLVVVGLAMVYSASAVVAQEKYHSPYTFIGKQVLWALAGLVAMLFLSRLDYAFYKSRRFIFSALFVSTFLLVLVFFFPSSHNTHRWIRFGDFFTLQPSEIAKPVLVLFLAWFLSTRLDKINQWRALVCAGLIPLVFIALVVLEPDLGTALVLSGVTVMMLFLAGLNWKFVIGAVCAALPVLLWELFAISWRLTRIQVFERFLLHPVCDIKEAGAAGYHTCQSLIAVGSGGVTGLGFMDGQQKLFFLPEPYNDFIFANIAEEMGFIGAIVLLLLFAYFGYRGLRTAFRSHDSFARLAAFGITMTILLQAFFNISVVIALLPTKGLPLPLISSGGTSLVFTLASIGILLNISRKAD